MRQDRVRERLFVSRTGKINPVVLGGASGCPGRPRVVAPVPTETPVYRPGPDLKLPIGNLRALWTARRLTLSWVPVWGEGVVPGRGRAGARRPSY